MICMIICLRDDISHLFPVFSPFPIPSYFPIFSTSAKFPPLHRQMWSACGRKWILSSTCGENAAGLEGRRVISGVIKRWPEHTLFVGDFPIEITI